MDLKEMALEYHRKYRGKVATAIKAPVDTKEDLSLAYTPGVGAVSLAIAEDKSLLNEFTNRGNTVAIVSDGSAVLGLGNIGPEAAMAVMEGKAVLFKKFADIDAVPICLKVDNKDDKDNIDTIVNIVKSLEPTFGGINLEDISAPRCFEIEDRLKKEMNIPVFHDDQHGTAVVVLAALINALKVVHGVQCTVHHAQGKQIFEKLRIVINGAGAAGTAIAKLLHLYGFTNIIALDSKGILCDTRNDLNSFKISLRKILKRDVCCKLEDAMKGADVFIGTSKPGLLTQDMIKTMNKDSIIFAMANPVPEIMPDEAKSAGARIVATGRSDFPNQINNVLAFPGIFRGAFDSGARQIADVMKIAAAEAIAGIVTDEELNEEYIIPSPFNPEVATRTAKAVAESCVDCKVKLGK